MGKVRMYKVCGENHNVETETRDFFTSYKVAFSKEEIEGELSFTALSIEEIDISIDIRKLMKSLKDGGFCDSEVEIISDLICKSFQSVEF